MTPLQADKIYLPLYKCYKNAGYYKQKADNNDTKSLKLRYPASKQGTNHDKILIIYAMKQ